MIKRFVAGLALGAVALCLVTPGFGADLPGPGLQTENAWIRWLPADLPAGGYVTLVNPTSRAVVVVGADSPDYTQVELHQSVQRQGVESMVPVASLTVAPHTTLDFAAHGYHLMLMQPRMPMLPGAHVPVRLLLAGGGSITAIFQVRPPTAGAAGSSSTVSGKAHH